MSIKICKIEGCGRKHSVKGLCHKHYRRWRTHGDPNKNTRPRDRTCSIEGCENKHKAKGLCSKHYTMQRIYDRTHCIRPRHGYTSGHMFKEYQSYKHMLSRCYNKRDQDYKYYGGRGISVCPEWRHSFLAFYSDMGDRPEGHTIDRKDNDGNYTPENCHWASRTEQARNSRRCRLNIIAVRVIRWLLKNTDIEQKRIAFAYGISQATVSNIYSNKTWKEEVA